MVARKTALLPLLLVACLLSGPAMPRQATARDTVTWPYLSYPPLFIVEGEKVSGIGPDIENILREKLSDYDHRRVDASPARMIEDMKAGKKYAVIGMIKNPARQAFLHYSRIPCRLSPATAVQVRKGEEGRFGEKGQVSVAALLLRTDLIWGYSPRVSYGPDLDKLLAGRRLPPSRETFSHAREVSLAIKMLIGKRIDWWIVDPAVAGFVSRKLGVESQVSYLRPIENKRAWSVGFVVAPRNAWGKKLIDQIDRVLAQQVTTARFFQIGARWLPPSLKASYRQAYDRLIKKAALEYR